MAKLLNGLPLAVHHASGGDARVRSGGASISCNAVSSGSFQVNGTKYRLFVNMRDSNDMMVLAGYTSPVTFANASVMVIDTREYVDEVPDGTTVYFTLISPTTFAAANGAAKDYIYTSYYS